MKFWEIFSRDLEGQTVFILGGGPSFDPRDLHLLSKVKVISVNSSVFYAWWGELFFSDRKWLKWNAKWLDKWKGVVYTTMSSYQNETTARIKVLRHKVDGWPDPDMGLLTGYDSGAQTIDLVRKRGAARIVLLGFDMGPSDESQHWHEGYPRTTRPERYDQFLAQYPKIQEQLRSEGISLLRGTEGGRLKFIPYVPIGELVKHAQSVA